MSAMCEIVDPGQPCEAQHQRDHVLLRDPAGFVAQHGLLVPPPLLRPAPSVYQ